MGNTILNPYDFRKMSMKLNNHKGFEAYRLIMSYRTSLSTFNLNFLELKKLLASPDILNLLEVQSIKRWKRQRMIQKCLFNTITSALTYIEHLQKKEILNIFSNSSTEIYNKIPIFCFFKSLRNYIVHYNSFDLITVYRAEITFQALKKNNFEDYLISQTKNPKRSWDKTALSYLQGMADKEDIMIHLELYRNYIQDIHKTIIVNSINGNYEELLNFREIFEQTTNFQDIQYPLNLVQLRHLDILLTIAKKHLQ